jgi:DNA-binding transcriptional LysR family regulator
MNFRQIETFRAVMLTGSMTAAAAQLHTSQPNVSRTIGQLEAEIGYELFDRLPGRVLPTRGGEALFKEVERAFVGLDSVSEAARGIREMGAGTLRVAAAASVSVTAIPPAIRLFSERYPSVRVVVETSESTTIANWVAMRHCDLGFVAYVADKPGVAASVIHRELAVCIMPAAHRLARKKRIVPADLAGERFISLPAGRPSRAAVDAGFPPQDGRIMALETTFASTICAMVSEGLGVSLVSPIVARVMNVRGVVTRPFKPDVVYPSYLLMPQLAPRDMHASHFIGCMRSAFRSLSRRSG